MVVFGVLATGGRWLDDFGVVGENFEEFFVPGFGACGDGAVREV